MIAAYENAGQSFAGGAAPLSPPRGVERRDGERRARRAVESAYDFMIESYGAEPLDRARRLR